MIWGYHYFWKHPYTVHESLFNSSDCSILQQCTNPSIGRSLENLYLNKYLFFLDSKTRDETGKQKRSTICLWHMREDLQGNMSFQESFMVCCKTHQLSQFRFSACDPVWPLWRPQETSETSVKHGETTGPWLDPMWQYHWKDYEDLAWFKPTVSGFSYEIYNEFLVEVSNEHQYCIRFKELTGSCIKK